MEKEELTRTDIPAQVQALEKFIQRLGLDLFGYTDGAEIRRYQKFYDERPKGRVSVFETGGQEEKCLLDGNYLSIAFPYAHELAWPKEAHFSVYVRGPDYHLVVREYLTKVCRFIEDMGYSAVPYCDSNALPERLIAVLSGLGFIGWNQMLITRTYGSFVFLGEIKTDLPVPVKRDDIRPDDRQMCGSCRRCIAACPTKILGTDQLKTSRCLSCLTQMKQHADDELGLLEGRLFGCDTCQRVCPWNQDKADRGLSDFAPFDFMAEPDLEELAVLSKSTFAHKYQKSSAGWRGKAVLSKNALIALARLGRLPEGLAPDSPVVRAIYDRLSQAEPK